LRSPDEANKSGGGGAGRDARSNLSPSRRPDNANKSGGRGAGHDVTRDQTSDLCAAWSTQTGAAKLPGRRKQEQRGESGSDVRSNESPLRNPDDTNNTVIHHCIIF